MINYSDHGTAKVSIVYIPNIVKNRLLHLSTKSNFSWAIRDYICNVILRSGNSELELADIENMINYSTFPEYRAVGRRNEWRSDLIRLSQQRFASNYNSTEFPNTSFGEWKNI